MAELEEPEWISYVDAATLADRSVSWVRTAANRGEIRRRADPGQYQHRWVARADVEQLAADRPHRTRRRKVPPAPAGAMTLDDAASTLGAAHYTVRRWLMDGRLSVHTRRHPYTYVTEASVRTLLAELYEDQDPAELMTYTEAAAELGVTIQAVRRLIRAGQLRPVGAGRRAQLRRAEVENHGAAPR